MLFSNNDHTFSSSALGRLHHKFTPAARFAGKTADVVLKAIDRQGVDGRDAERRQRLFGFDLVVNDLKKGVYNADKYLSAPTGNADPYAADLVSNYWTSIRQLVHQRLVR